MQSRMLSPMMITITDIVLLALERSLDTVFGCVGIATGACQELSPVSKVVTAYCSDGRRVPVAVLQLKQVELYTARIVSALLWIPGELGSIVGRSERARSGCCCRSLLWLSVRPSPCSTAATPIPLEDVHVRSPEP